MPYIESQRRNELLAKQDDYLTSNRDMMNRKPETVLFYEFEPAIVLDIILDENHPEIKNKTINADDFPKNIDGKVPNFSDTNFSWIGRIKFRMVYSQKGTEKELLEWAIPLENTGVTEYPLVNEVVSIVKYFSNFYYTRKINIKNLINANADISLERFYGPSGMNREEGGTTIIPYKGPQSVMNATGTPATEYVGAVGRYFKFNPNIRTIKRYEGDTVFESRFGSSIHIGAYDDNRKNDNGIGEYSDGGGNPMLLIRNRQGSVSHDPKNPGYLNKGYVTESINNDGSSIQLTSGKTITSFIPTTKKIMFQSGIPEEQQNFSPVGSTSFKFPKLDGDQTILNSDRIIISSKAGETFHYSKKRYSIVTDDEYTVDSHKQIVMTTNAATTINSPMIFLGEWGNTEEPVLLGRSTALWLYTLCDWLISQTDWLIQTSGWDERHKHIDFSGTTGIPTQDAIDSMEEYIAALKEKKAHLIELRDSIPQLMSERVFTVGGGGAPGQDGGQLK